jgi:NAD(P)-dependent dehydrogenase (short-subunit alcohol dehydrogenase family)
MGLLQEKNIVITGGSRGFGLVTAHACIEAGAKVAIASRSAKTVANAVDTLQSMGEVMGTTCDVADLAQVKALAQSVIDAWGNIDVWINNAAITAPYGPTLSIKPEAFIKVINVNLLGTYHGSIVAMQHFLPQRHGKLINILGNGDKRPAPMQVAYGSSKNWVLTFTRALAWEYKKSGVDVFAYNPGLMRTDLVTEVEVIQGYENRMKVFETVMRMWAKPLEIPAQKIVKLSSRGTDGKTGKIIREMNFLSMLAGSAREGWRRFFKRPLEHIPIKVHTVPAVRSGDMDKN